MPAKYQCTVCSRSFVHRETLTEHKLLHSLAILEENTFSCPVCQRKVTCRSGVHQLSKTCLNMRSQAIKLCQSGADERLSARKTKTKRAYSEDGRVNVLKISKACGLKVRLKEVSAKPKELLENDMTNSSGNVSCKICNKSFVYQKCLQKHTALVHGLSQEVQSDGELKSANEEENAAVPTSADISVDDPESVKKSVIWQGENCQRDPDNQRKLKLASGVSRQSRTKSPTKERSDCGSRSAELRTTVSDLTCNMCHKSFKHRTMLLRHMHTVHDAVNYEKCSCPYCMQEFTSQWTFSKHFETVHKMNAEEALSRLAAVNGSNSSEDIAWCEKCHQWFTCWPSFIKHCSLKHRGDPNFMRVLEENDQVPDSAEPLVSGPNKGELKTEDSESRDSGSDNSPTGPSSGKGIQLVSSDEVKSDGAERSSKCFCSVCCKSFATVSFLDRHMRIKHSSSPDESLSSRGKSECKNRKQTFVCGHCSEEFREEKELVEHVELHHDNANVDDAECSCPICGCSCPNQSLFSMHYDAVHCTRLYEPDAAATAETTGSTIRRCRACELWFTSAAVLQGHHCAKRTPTRQPPKTGRARYRCKLCGEAFEILRRFLHHRKVKHRVVGPDKTDPSPAPQPPADLSVSPEKDLTDGTELDTPASQCPRGRPPKLESEDDKDKDGDHEEQEQSQVDQPAKPRMPRGYARNVPSDGAPSLKCPECNRVFATVAQLRRHRKSEHRNRTCQLCGETCKSADMVYYHNLKYHHEQKCEVCGASCSGRLGLIDHYRTEHPSEPPPLINRKTLICEYCPRVFAGCASRLLRDHIESCHLGRVHLCDVCGKRLGSAQTLAVHRRMHDPVARFECRECNRRFPHNTNLINHIRKHHPERLPAKYVREFRCEMCSMQFASSSGLTRHRSEKHGTQRYQCESCLRVFQSAAGLRLHKRRDHQPKDAVTTFSPLVSVTAAESEMPPPAAPQVPVVTQFSADHQTNAIMAGFMANMIGFPSLSVAQTFQ